MILAFHLLDVRSMPLESLPSYVDTVGIYRDVNAALLGLSPAALAGMLVSSLERSGALRRDGDAIRAA